MPANARVTLCYGPSESSGVVKHRTFRLQGLQGLSRHGAVRVPARRLPAITVIGQTSVYLSTASLGARGHQCVLEETQDWNVVELVVSGEVVFSCHIKKLEFGEFGWFSLAKNPRIRVTCS